ncbi:uncharacterized protein LOC110901011 [Helianthus annuus]|uniref:uncharacterized protein LOC110901011 n=1 Tax=Helianthus annuus TaxID=4232 RepID=UPI000B8F01D2|nr:uncharacterized protein LOC110901011 [Helianthus annuus]
MVVENKREPVSAWAKVVTGIHGRHNASFNQHLIPLKKSVPGVWKDIGSIELALSKIGINIKDKIVHDETVWRWHEDPTGSFSIKHVRKDIEKAMLQESNDGYVYGWNNWATPKANYLLWRALLGKITSKVGLIHRGINLGDSLCPRCGLHDECPNHIFANCLWANCVWWNILTWVRISFINCDNLKDLIIYITQSPGDKVWKKAVYMIAIGTVWRIWWPRNEKLFKDNFIRINRLVELIKEDAYLWISNRSKLKSIKWESRKVFDILEVM